MIPMDARLDNADLVVDCVMASELMSVANYLLNIIQIKAGWTGRGGGYFGFVSKWIWRAYYYAKVGFTC